MNALQDRQSTVDPGILNQNSIYPRYGNVMTVPDGLDDDALSKDQSFTADNGMYYDYTIPDIQPESTQSLAEETELEGNEYGHEHGGARDGGDHCRRTSG